MYLQAFFIFAGFYLNQFVGRAGWLGLESLSARFGKLAGPSGWHDGRDVGLGRGLNVHGDSSASGRGPGNAEPQPRAILEGM